MKIVGLVLTLIMGIQAHAGILFEPMVSYEMGTTKQTFTSDGAGIRGSDTQDGDNTAMNYGGRIGYLFAPSGFWFAGSYTASSSGKTKYESHDVEYTRSAYGVDLGFWRGRWNFWVGYNVSDKLDFTQPGGNGDDHISGTSYKLGIGFLLYHHIAFNIEGVMRSYTSGETTSADMVYADFTKYVKSFEQMSYSAGLSFPF